jgi:hypothetical protein
VGSSPQNTYPSNYDELWRGYDRYYSYFEHKKVNWDSLYTAYLPRVEDARNDIAFSIVLSDLLSNLRDGHAQLISPYGTYTYNFNFESRAEYNSNLISSRYLDDSVPGDENSAFQFHTIDDIGYLRIESFSNDFTFKGLDLFLKSQSDQTGLIIDVRDNGGGSDLNSYFVASRFTNQRTLVRKVRYRNGPDHNDFSEPIENYINPDGFYYDKPVAVLINRGVFSAAEDFVLAMRQFPNVTIIGTNTGGGSGNPITFDLPNGWLYRVSRWQVLQPENDLLYEEIGLEPDIYIRQLAGDNTLQRDSRLEFTLNWLRSLE